jgi:hypothetical protein
MNDPPTVLVIGAGHSDLEITVPPKCIGAPTLIIDKKRQVGDNVRRVSIPTVDSRTVS